MRKIYAVIVVAVTLLVAVSSQAQVKFGLKGGLNVTNMSFSSNVIKKDNRTGFFIGPMVKINIPVGGLGVDAAVLYDQRDAKIGDGEDETTTSLRSINIPINLRYSFGLGSLASVYAAAGPQFGFNVGSKTYILEDVADYRLKDSNFSINLGLGVTVLSHVEVGYTYNIACGKTGEMTVKDGIGQLIEGTKTVRANAHQIHIAYLF